MQLVFPHLTQKIGVVGAPPNIGTDSDVEIIDVKSPDNIKGKRGAGQKVDWDLSDGDSDPYERFKNRKQAQRKKIAAIKKRLKLRTKNAVKNNAKEKGERLKERMWDASSGDEEVDEEIPSYIQQRRKEFDDTLRSLQEAGLRLPPRYNDIDFSDDERLADLEERPDLGAVEKSRSYKDIELRQSAGIIPASVAQYLRDYQVEGVAFLHELFVYQKGGILGDDMGLGKTVQVAAFLTVAFGKTGDERDRKRMRKMRRNPNKPWYPRILIICPSSLIENWKNELARWGFWHVDKYHGLDKESVLQSVISGRLEVVITTYQTYRNSKDELNLVMWEYVSSSLSSPSLVS